jgi:hypothetical protein
MKQKTKNRLKAVYIIYVLVMFVLYMCGGLGINLSTNDEVMIMFFMIVPIPIYYAVHLWNKIPKD